MRDLNENAGMTGYLQSALLSTFHFLFFFVFQTIFHIFISAISMLPFSLK